MSSKLVNKSYEMKTIFILTFLLIFNYSDSWSPVGDHIKTQWAKKVDPLNVWPEYPRPQLVRKEWVNLNGLWDYTIIGPMDKEPVNYEGKILVPFGVESSLSGVMKAVTHKALWYRRHFNSSVTSDESLILNFGAVDYECHVFINGHSVGDHKGGYNRFSFDITKFLNANKENTLVLKVIDNTGGAQPIGKQRPNPGGIFYTSTSGIWQTVWLERVPKTHVKDLIITPDIDKESVDINVLTTNSLDKIEIKILDKTGKVVASNSDAHANKVNTLKISSPKLWSTTDPYLYDIHIKAGNDSVTSYVGLRKMEVKKDSKGINRFFLNGKPIFMFGPLDQGFWPDGVYTPPNEEAMIYDLLMTRKIGFNTVRKHVKVESDRYYYATDKMGFLVWQDFPSAFDGVKSDTRVASDAKQIELEMETMVNQLHNFPSIIMWVPFNEGWGQYDTKRIVELFKKWDPSRPVNEASGWNDHKVSNIEDHHSYPTSKEIKLNANRVVVNGEYGGGGLLVKEHIWMTKVFQYQGFNNSKELQKFFVDRLATVRAHAIFGLGAAIYTQTTDVEGEINGFMTYDRAMFKVESADEIAKEVHRLYPSESVEDIILASGHFSDSQEWFYTTNKPTDDWSHIDFDATHWSKGKSGFGGGDAQDLTIRTQWKTPDIWLRKEFDISVNKIPKHPVLHIFYDDIAQVYINGHKLDKVFDPHQTSYSAHDIDPKILKSGKNTIAIHCHQISGGQGIDAGIYEISY